MSANRDVHITAVYDAFHPQRLTVNLNSPLGRDYFIVTFDLAWSVHYEWQANNEIYFDHGSWRDNPATNAVEAWFDQTGIGAEIVQAYRSTFDLMKADYAQQLREFASGLETKAARILPLSIEQTSREMYGIRLEFKPSAKYDKLTIYDRTWRYDC